MLVLSRRENEWIKIGESVTVTVVRLGADKVRIGIEAPSNVLILRGELEQRESLDHNSSLESIPMEKIDFTLPINGSVIVPTATSSSLAG